MTLLYFKRKVDDELEDAKHYINDAINMKERKPAWAKSLADISDMELLHARKFMDMFNTYYMELFPDGATDEMEEVKADMMEEYTRRYEEVMHLHDLYKM